MIRIDSSLSLMAIVLRKFSFSSQYVDFTSRGTITIPYSLSVFGTITSFSFSVG